MALAWVYKGSNNRSEANSCNTLKECKTSTRVAIRHALLYYQQDKDGILTDICKKYMSNISPMEAKPLLLLNTLAQETQGTD